MGNNGRESTTDNHFLRQIDKDEYADLSDDIYIEPGVYVSSGFDRKRNSEESKVEEGEEFQRQTNILADRNTKCPKNHGLSFKIQPKVEVSLQYNCST